MVDRRASRILAMQALCLFDSMGEAFAAQLDDFLADESPPPSVAAYARQLVLDTRSHQAEIDALIQASLENWDLRRLVVVDRNALRVAVCEMTYRPDIPKKVAVNEAIEICKEFGTRESAAFINGILDAMINRPSSSPVADDSEQAVP